MATRIETAAEEFGAGGEQETTGAWRRRAVLWTAGAAAATAWMGPGTQAAARAHAGEAVAGQGDGAVAQRMDGAAPGPLPAALGRAPRLVVQSGRLVWGGRPFAALGANVWQLQNYFAPGLVQPFTTAGTTWNGSFSGDPARGERILAEAAAYGLRVIRFISMGWNPAWLHYWLTQPQLFWRGHDALMAAAGRYGVYLVPSLVWHAMPFAVATGESNAAVFTPGTQAHALMLRYVREYVGRYRSHPNVLMWELGNEWNLMVARGPRNKWYFDTVGGLRGAMRAVTAVIKAVDPDHLVESGMAMPAVDQGADLAAQQQAFALANQYADVACLHVYPQYESISPAQAAIYKAAAAQMHIPLPSLGGASVMGMASVPAYLRAMAVTARTVLRKPLIVGEFGQDYVRHPHAGFVRDVLQGWAEGVFPLALVWSWMAAPSSNASGLASSVDPTTRPYVANLFRQFARRRPWPSPPGTR